MADLAYFFHWPPSELWEMDLDEMLMWAEQACKISETYGGPVKN
jgi:hypothetical protein